MIKVSGASADAMIDFVGLGYCSNDHLCRLPEIPIDHKVEIIEYRVQGGGPAATATVAAARLGVRAAFATSVGPDEAGKDIIRDLEAEGIDARAIVRRDTGGSPISHCWVDPQGHRSIAWTRNGLRWLSADEIPADLIARARILHLDGHHPEAALAAARLARRHGVTVSYDAGTFRDNTVELAKEVDILIASAFFARIYAADDDPRRALTRLRRDFPQTTVTGVTLGADGSLFWIDGDIVAVPAFAGVEVVDTTGAGDAFHGAFAARWLSCKDIAACARFASAVSAIKCGALGARAGIPTLEKVESFLKACG